ncbi:MAG: hypothetical protein AAF602_29965, partial [Myxococcota bacterium]
MSFRPWVVLGALVVAFVANLALILAEDLPPAPPDATTDRVSPIGQLVYAPGNRTRNLQLMGLDAAGVDEANRQMTALSPETERLRRVLEGQTQLAATAFCGQELPPPYAALQVLVVQDNDVRAAITPDRLVRLEAAPFYGAFVGRLHDRFELATPRPASATPIAGGAVLASREAEAQTTAPP